MKMRMPRIRRFMERPCETQEEWFQQLLRLARNTEWGREYGFKNIRNHKDWINRIPVQDYDSIKPYIERMMYGEKNVLWTGKVNWFSKSSGTTSDKSKYIPVSLDHHRLCLMRGGWDTQALYNLNHTNPKVFKNGKGVVMGGALEHFPEYPKTIRGDVSALMIQNMPGIAKYFMTPDVETALMSEWEAKIDKIARLSISENVTNLSGVPTWTIVLFRKILEMTGKENILEVWPNFEQYIHGGVSFTPYREQFKQFFPFDQVSYMEVYNASEGFFSASCDFRSDDMLLYVDHGIYYEFLPSEEWNKDFPNAIALSEVEIGKQYAIVISTNSGLWRYMPGDTVKFTSTSPYKIKVTGRTKHFINAFGEEVVIENTDTALALTCQQMDVKVKEYTVAPVYFEGHGKGGHEWLIEFEQQPRDLAQFTFFLDENLQMLNSDYEAKRYRNMALSQLVIRSLPKGSFYTWMKNRGKYGGQSKVPRLANHRKFVEEILEVADGIV